MPGNATVLILESDKNDLFFLQRAFRKVCPSCVAVGVITVEDTIKYLSGEPPYSDRAQHPLPAMLLMDLNIPGLTGFDLLKWLQTRPDLDSVAVVVLTGSAYGSDLQKALDLGADEHHIKRHDYDHLHELIRDISARWLPVTDPHNVS